MPPTKIKLLIGLILVVGIISRVLFLDQIPVNTQYDELVHVVNAKVATLTGTNLSQDWSPFSLRPVDPMYSEATATLIMPFLLLPLPLRLAAKVPFIVMSLLVPFFIAGIAQELSKRPLVSSSPAKLKSQGNQPDSHQLNLVFVFALLISMFNPWIWQIGRLGFDSYPSFFFYILGTYLFLRLRGWPKLWSLLPFFIGFYQYQGYKLILPLWVVVLMIYELWPRAKQIWATRSRAGLAADAQQSTSQPLPKVFATLVVGLFCLGLSIFYFTYQLPSQSNSFRAGELLLPTNPTLVTETLQNQHLTLDGPVGRLLPNRYTTWGL
jgi:hypothetical protein